VRKHAGLVVLAVVTVAVLTLVGLKSRSDRRDPPGFDRRSADGGPGGPSATADASGESPASSSTNRGRAEIPTPASSGLVLDEHGSPVRDATISWTSFDGSDREWEPALQHDNWGPLQRPTLESKSDAKGHYEFLAAPGYLESGSVIWATYPGFEAGCLLLGGEGEASVNVGIIQLRSSRLLGARVVDVDGAPVDGAVVAQYGLVPRFQSVVGGPAEVRSRRFLFRTATTGPDGRVSLPTFPGEQVIQASREDRVSIPWRGENRGEVVLTLGEAFFAEGRVTFPDWSSGGGHGEGRITIAAQRGSTWYGLVDLRSIGDGTWGPVTLPILPSARYRLRLEGSPVVPEERDFGTPAVGARLWFDLEPQVGHVLWVVALDEEENPILDSEATATWQENGTTNLVRAHSRPGTQPVPGMIALRSLPATTVQVRISAPGYIADISDPLAVPIDYTLPLILTRAGHLRGRCLHDGKPVEDFELVTWKPSFENYRLTHAFHGRMDGSFELDDVPVGDLFVTASSTSYLCPEPSRVTIPREGAAEIAIELAATQVGAGFVVDATTEAPIPSAKIQALVMGEWMPVAPWGPPLGVGSDGTFELSSLVAGLNLIEVSAQGYSTKRLSVRVSPGEEVEVGRVALERPQSLEIQLTTAATPAGSVDFVAYFVSEVTAAGMAELDTRPFSREGKVSFEGVDAGLRLVQIEREGDPWAQLTLDLRTGEAWTFQHRVAGARRLTIEVLPDRGKDITDTPGLFVRYVNSQGVSTILGVEVPSSGTVDLEGIDAENVIVDLLDRDWKETAVVRGTFQGRDELHMTVEAGGKPFLFRIVDVDRLPIPGATITVNDAASPALALQGTTDSDGRYEMLGVPEDEITVSVFRVNGGTRNGVVVDGSAGEAEIVLESDAKVIVVLKDGDVSIPDISCWMINAYGYSLGGAKAADAAGAIEWEGLTSGTFRFAAKHPSCWPIIFEAQANKDAVPQVVQIRRLGELSMELRTSGGLPVSGQRVELESVEFSTSVESWLAQGKVHSSGGLVSDREGRIRIEGLPRGDYRWRVDAAGGETVSGSVTVEPAEAITLPIQLP
jgi:hypothetical protein